MKRNLAKLGLITLGFALVGGTSAYWWHQKTCESVLMASVPKRPELRDWKADFKQRLEACEELIQSGPGRREALGELSALYHANGFLTEASRCYRGLIAVDGGDPRWAHRLATIYAGYGELESAITLWRRVTKQEDNYLPARIRLADALMKQNKASEAQAQYEAVLAKEKAQPYALMGLARLDMASGRWTVARTRLEIATTQTGFAIGGDLLVTVYEALGQDRLAREIRSRAKSAGAFNDVPDPWVEAMYESCYDPYRLSVVGGLAAHGGDVVAAVRLLERALLIAPEDSMVHYQLGMLWMQQGEQIKAREQLELCTRYAPDFPDGWAQLVVLHTAMGDEEQAERALAHGLAKCPRSPGLHLERARRLAQTAHYDDAIRECLESIRLRPDEASACMLLGTIYVRLGRIDEGLRTFEQALVAEPEYPPALATLAYAAIETGDEPKARSWLRRVDAQARVEEGQREALRAAFKKRFGGE